MGLDITAYSYLRAVGKHEKDVALNEGEPGGTDDWCYYEGHVHAFAYDSFPRSFAGIPVLGTGGGLLEGGCYAITPATETHRFHAGSYGGYNAWRKHLAAQFNPSGTEDNAELGIPVPLEPDPEKPFYELIWFADNEGTIGEVAAANLVADFRAHAANYNPEHPYGAEYMLARYVDWTRACELAADGGLISFH